MSDAVLVTGGSGFIGTWVLRELIKCNLAPIAFDLAPAPERWRRILGTCAAHVEFEQGSLIDHERLRAVCIARDVNHIIHLAAMLTPACQQDPWLGCQVNVLGTVSIFEAIRRSRGSIKGFSYASSLAVFGPELEDTTATYAARKNRPPSFYGAFKQAVETIAEQYWRHFGIASVGLRPHVVYGPERDQGLTAGPSLAARAAAVGDEYTIGYRGHLGYDYVVDVARAFVQAAMETPLGANVVELPNTQATCEDFVSAIEAVVPDARDCIRIDGPDIPSNIAPHPDYISRLFPDWRATSLIEGVRQTVDFYRNVSEPAAKVRASQEEACDDF